MKIITKIIAAFTIIVLISPIFFVTANYAVEEVENLEENQEVEPSSPPSIEPEETATPKEDPTLEPTPIESPEVEATPEKSEEDKNLSQEEEIEEDLKDEVAPIMEEEPMAINVPPLLENGEIYEIYFADTTKVLDVNGPSKANKANVTLWERSDQDNQKFRAIYNSDDGTYTFKCIYSTLVIDALGGVAGNGVNIAQYEAHNPYTDNQRWYVEENPNGTYSIRSKLGNYCLDITGGDVGGYNGQNAELYTSHRGRAQQFRFVKYEKPKSEFGEKVTDFEEGIYQIKTKKDTVIDISNASYTKGSNALIWYNKNSNNQKYYVKRFEENGETYYTITAVHSNLALDVCGASKSAKAKIIQHPYNNAQNQQWILRKSGEDNYYLVESRYSNKVLDVTGGNISAVGTELEQYDYNGGDNQKFRFEKAYISNNEKINIVPKNRPGKCVDIYEASQNEGAQAILYERSNTANQAFTLEPINTLEYIIRAKHSKQVLQADGNDICQYKEARAESQKWVLEPAGENSFKIRTKSANKYITVEGDKLKLEVNNNSDNQKFIIEPPSGSLNGIDVSDHNSIINWQQVDSSNYSDFAIIRLGYRGYAIPNIKMDANFLNNIVGARAAGIPFGVYFYTQAVTVAEAIEEANFVINTVRQYCGDIKYPIYVDTENSPYGTGRADNLNQIDRTNIVGAFCVTIRNAGYTAGIYANRDWFYYNLNMDLLNQNEIWLAHYASQTNYRNHYEIWQYSSKGSVPGIATEVDLNKCYKKY